MHGLLSDAADRAAQRFDLALVRGLLALGFFEHLQDFVKLFEHFAQLAGNVLDLRDGFADGLWRGGLKRWRRRWREIATWRIGLAARGRLATFPCGDWNRGGRGFVGTFLGCRGKIAFAFALVNFAFFTFRFGAVGHFGLMCLDHFMIGRVSFGQGGVTCGRSVGVGDCGRGGWRFGVFGGVAPAPAAPTASTATTTAAGRPGRIGRRRRRSRGLGFGVGHHVLIIRGQIAGCRGKSKQNSARQASARTAQRSLAAVERGLARCSSGVGRTTSPAMRA